MNHPAGTPSGTKNKPTYKTDALTIQMYCGTLDDHLPTIREFHEALLKAGVDHTYVEIAELSHERGKMIAQNGPVWFSHHAESLRQAAQRANGK